MPCELTRKIDAKQVVSPLLTKMSPLTPLTIPLQQMKTRNGHQRTGLRNGNMDTQRELSLKLSAVPETKFLLPILRSVGLLLKL